MKRLPLILSAVAILLASISFYLATSSSQLVYVDVNQLIEGGLISKEINGLNDIDNSFRMNDKYIVADGACVQRGSLSGLITYSPVSYKECV